MPPPTLPPIPPPTDLRRSAKLYLESHGVVARTPPLRSSNVVTALTDPFRFYLANRLGIVPIWSWSAALATGTWFHRRGEIFWQTPPTGVQSPEHDHQLATLLQTRQEEIRSIGLHLGLSAQKIQDLIDEEVESFDLASVTFQCCLYKVPLPGHRSPTTLSDLLRTYTFVCAEEVFQYRPEEWRPYDPPLYAQPDAILVDAANAIWIIDWKTCTEATTLRLQLCSIEQQTLQYLDVIKNALAAGDPRLPKNATLGGMIHIACQKPSIRMSGEDRDFTISTKVLKGGPNKGQERTERVFHGEPRFANYVERVTRWMLGIGEYLDKAAERAANPVINTSTIHFRSIDADRWARYNARIEVARQYATCEPFPGNFPDNPNSLRQMGGKLSPYLPFYTEPVSKWPSLIASGGFIITHRDEPTDAPADDNDDPADLLPG